MITIQEKDGCEMRIQRSASGDVRIFVVHPDKPGRPGGDVVGLRLTRTQARIVMLAILEVLESLDR